MQVGGRESDIPALIQGAQAVGWPVDILVRSKHNRRLPEGARLWGEVQASEPIGEIEFTVTARAGRKARVVRQQLRLKRVALHHGEAFGAIEMTCLVASEIDAPASEKPVCARRLPRTKGRWRAWSESHLDRAAASRGLCRGGAIHAGVERGLSCV